MQRDTSPSHRVDPAVDCGLWKVASLFNGCAKLLDIGAAVHVDPEYPKHAQWVTCLVSMQAMEELRHFPLPGIVYRFLRHGTVHYHAETFFFVFISPLFNQVGQLRTSSHLQLRPGQDKAKQCDKNNNTE